MLSEISRAVLQVVRTCVWKVSLRVSDRANHRGLQANKAAEYAAAYGVLGHRFSPTYPLCVSVLVTYIHKPSLLFGHFCLVTATRIKPIGHGSIFA